MTHVLVSGTATTADGIAGAKDVKRIASPPPAPSVKK